MLLGPVEDRTELAGSFFPVNRELHSLIVESALVDGVEDAAPAILRRAIKGLDEIALCRPDAHPLGLEILLGNPQTPVVGQGQPVGIVHPQGIIGARLGNTGLSDGADEIAFRVEDFHLMGLPPQADIDVAIAGQNQALRIVQIPDPRRRSVRTLVARLVHGGVAKQLALGKD